MSQPSAEPQPGLLRCPKCSGTMRTYERNGIHLEQCDTCRGIFLDFGELEALTQLEARIAQQQAPPPYQQGQAPYQQVPHQPSPYQQGPYQQPPAQQPPYGPSWGSRGSHHYRRGGFGRLFFSS